MNGTHTHTIRTLVVAAILLATVSSPGCMWAPELSRLRRDIETQMPGSSFDREFAITLGPITMGIARFFTSLVPDEDVRTARDLLRDVSHVQLAVYRHESRASFADVKMPGRLRELQQYEGWELAIKVREQDNLVWILYRLQDETIKDVYVVVLSDDELVMVRAHGKLDRLVARALQEAEGTRGIPHVSDGSS